MEAKIGFTTGNTQVFTLHLYDPYAYWAATSIELTGKRNAKMSEIIQECLKMGKAPILKFVDIKL